jgi:hypothetical protein
VDEEDEQLKKAGLEPPMMDAERRKRIMQEDGVGITDYTLLDGANPPDSGLGYVDRYEFVKYIDNFQKKDNRKLDPGTECEYKRAKGKIKAREARIEKKLKIKYKDYMDKCNENEEKFGFELAKAHNEYDERYDSVYKEFNDTVKELKSSWNAKKEIGITIAGTGGGPSVVYELISAIGNLANVEINEHVKMVITGLTGVGIMYYLYRSRWKNPKAKRAKNKFEKERAAAKLDYKWKYSKTQKEVIRANDDALKQYIPEAISKIDDLEKEINGTGDNDVHPQLEVEA